MFLEMFFQRFLKNIFKNILIELWIRNRSLLKFYAWNNYRTVLCYRIFNITFNFQLIKLEY